MTNTSRRSSPLPKVLRVPTAPRGAVGEQRVVVKSRRLFGAVNHGFFFLLLCDEDGNLPQPRHDVANQVEDVGVKGEGAHRRVQAVEELCGGTRVSKGTAKLSILEIGIFFWK